MLCAFLKKNNVDVAAEFGEWVLLKLMFTFVCLALYELKHDLLATNAYAELMFSFVHKR